jgi:hypothetical protein
MTLVDVLHLALPAVVIALTLGIAAFAILRTTSQPDRPLPVRVPASQKPGRRHPPA